MEKRVRTRARRTKRVIDLTTDEITFAGRGPTDDRARAVRRALVLRWAQQRRRLDLAHREH
jgi:hypothetical protein